VFIRSPLPDATQRRYSDVYPRESHDRKGAIKAFIERYKPVQGWFLGDPEDITDNVQKEAEEAESKTQK
jgi:hypothetical protein